MPSIKVKGINLKVIKVGEADKIITLLTPDRGKISAIAKGARKPSSKFGGRLEAFAFNNYLLGEGRSLYVVSQVETIENYYSLREDEHRLHAAAFIVRLINQATEMEHRNPLLFFLLERSLRGLSSGINPEAIRIAFMLHLMDIEGFLPELSGCVKCRKRVIKEPKNVMFSLGHGGLICSSCSKKTTGGEQVPYHMIKTMLKIKSMKIRQLNSLDLDQKEAEKIKSIFLPYMSDHIGKDIRNW